MTWLIVTALDPALPHIVPSRAGISDRDGVRVAAAGLPARFGREVEKRAAAEADIEQPAADGSRRVRQIAKCDIEPATQRRAQHRRRYAPPRGGSSFGAVSPVAIPVGKHPA
jgi:hypothetical protein